MCAYEDQVASRSEKLQVAVKRHLGIIGGTNDEVERASVLLENIVVSMAEASI